jgi:hypothetical protein
VWSRNNGTNYIVQATSRPFGFAWTTPVDLSAPGQNAFQAVVAMDAKGNAIALWRRFNGTNDMVQTSSLPFGGIWSTPIDLSTPGQSSEQPQIAMTSSGYAVVDWRNDTLQVIQSVVWTPPPQVTDIHPNCGSNNGGNSVIIEGTDFTNVLYVKFGNLKSTCFTVLSPTKIRAVVPPRCKTGKVDVTVITKAGTSSTTKNDQYTYSRCGCKQ